MIVGDEMKLEKNIIITDNSVDDMNEFKNGIRETSNIEFKTYAMNANKGRGNKLKNFYKIFKIFLFSFYYFF